MLLLVIPMSCTQPSLISLWLRSVSRQSSNRFSEQSCLKYFKVLSNCGFRDESEVVKKRLVKEVKARLNIDLNFEASLEAPHDNISTPMQETSNSKHNNNSV